MLFKKLTVAIIGGGAAGMMAATCFKEVSDQYEVLLFEKNHYLGAKVLISGGGRCNVTTGIFDVRKLLENYPRGAKFLMSALYRFPPEKVIEWFQDRGVRLKTENDLRVFPVSNNGKDIVQILEKELQSTGVKILLKSHVIKVEQTSKESTEDPITPKKFTLFLKSGEHFEADYLILTTGGNAYRHTGSTGDGYAFAQALGHSLTDFAPSLNSFVVEEKWISKLAGVSLPKATLTLKRKPNFAEKNADLKVQKISAHTNATYQRTGPFLFTHHGISGPAIFALSAQSAYEQYDKNNPLELNINFFPDHNPENVKKFVQEIAQQHPKKHIVNFLDLFLPKSLSQVFGEILNVDATLTMGNLKQDLFKTLLNLLQNFSLTIVGRGAGDEFVTAGGVKLNEVNTNTMESKICPGLYFGGEILDIDGYTGGFNLQASWATGKLAGESIRTQGENIK